LQRNRLGWSDFKLEQLKEPTLEMPLVLVPPLSDAVESAQMSEHESDSGLRWLSV
jgi:hypothetical protein